MSSRLRSIPIASFLTAIAAGVGVDVVGHEAVAVTSASPSSAVPSSQPTASTRTGPAMAKAKKKTAAPAKSPASTFREAADVFFDAYRRGDRVKALTVSTQQAVNKLTWNPNAGDNPTLSLTCPGPTECFIYYEGGGINLTITGSAASGYRVVDTQPVAD
jgi:hypothetical protein